MGVVIFEGEGAVLGVNVGRPIVANGDGDELFPNYFGRTCLRCIDLFAGAPPPPEAGQEGRKTVVCVLQYRSPKIHRCGARGVGETD